MGREGKLGIGIEGDCGCRSGEGERGEREGVRVEGGGCPSGKTC